MIWLDLNDATSSRTSTQYIADIRTIISNIALPTTSSPLLVTYMPQMTTNTSGIEDSTVSGFLSAYRTEILKGVQTDGWSAIDAYKADPSVATMYANGYYTDNQHFTATYATHRWSILVKSLFSGYFNQYNATGNYANYIRRSALIAPNGIAGFGVSTESSGGALSETNTGWYGIISNGTNCLNYKIAGAEYLRMGSDGSTNTMILTAYPTSTFLTVLQAMRQGSTSTSAFKLGVDSSSNTTLSLNGGVGLEIQTSLGLRIDTGSLAAPAATLHLSGVHTQGAWTTNGVALRSDAAVFTDSSTAISGSQTTMVAHAFGAPTFAASNTGVTYTNIINGYFAAPVAGTNVTATNKYALYVAGLMGSLAGSSTKTATIGGKIKEYFTDSGNSTTTETDLYTYTTEANLLGTNGATLQVEYGGTFVSSATATREIKIYFGGTVLLDTGALTLTLSSQWTVYITIIRVSSTVVRYMASLTTEGAALAAYTSSGEITGLTLSNTNILKITGQAASTGAATNDIVAKLGSVYYWPVSV